MIGLSSGFVPGCQHPEDDVQRPAALLPPSAHTKSQSGLPMRDARETLCPSHCLSFFPRLPRDLSSDLHHFSRSTASALLASSLLLCLFFLLIKDQAGQGPSLNSSSRGETSHETWTSPPRRGASCENPSLQFHYHELPRVPARRSSGRQQNILPALEDEQHKLCCA